MTSKNVLNASSAPTGDYRNKIINGDFDYAQRASLGGAYTGTISAYQFDRWMGNSNTLTGSFISYSVPFTVGQTDVPGNPIAYARIVGASAVVGTNGSTSIQQRVENVRTFAGKTATVVFYAKSNVLRQMGVASAQAFGSGGSPSASVAIPGTVVNLTTSWQKFTFTVDFPSLAGKTIGTGFDHYIALAFVFSTKGTQTTAWGLPANIADLSNDIIDIAHVSLVEGDATLEVDPFTPRHAQQELALCQRYGQPIPDTAFGGYQVAANYNTFSVSLPVPMRTGPTLTAPTFTYTNASTGVATSLNNNAVQLRATTTVTGQYQFNTAGGFLSAEL
jgi:hypothetical protein